MKITYSMVISARQPSGLVVVLPHAAANQGIYLVQLLAREAWVSSDELLVGRIKLLCGTTRSTAAQVVLREISKEIIYSAGDE